MKKQMSYKAKRSMIILAVIVVLAIIASIGTYAFISGNDETQAMSQTNGTASDRAGQEVEQAQQQESNQGVQTQSEDNQNDNAGTQNNEDNEQIDVADANNNDNNDATQSTTSTNASTTTNNGTTLVNSNNNNTTTTTNNDGTNTPAQTTQTVTTTDEVETTETLVGFRAARLNNEVPEVSATLPSAEVPETPGGSTEESTPEDTTAPVYINMGIFNWTNDNDGDPDRTEDKLYATNGSHIRLFVTFPEMLGTNPKVDIYGKDDKVVATYELKYNGAEFYYVEFDISPDWDLPEGKIKYKVYGYADEAGNVGEDLTEENTLSKENPYVIFDKTAPGTGNQFEGFPLYILNISADNEDDIDKYPSHYQYIKEDKTLKIEANFTEMLDPYTKPEVTIKNGDKVLTGYYLEYRDKLGDKYRYTVDIPLNEENNSILQFEDGQKVEFTITNVRDIAGNYADFNNNNVTQYYRNDVLVYDQVTYDETAPVTDYVGILNVTHLRLNNNGANEVLNRATNGDEVRVLVRFAEPLTVEPTVKLGGREYTAKYNKGISGDTGYYYYAADIELDEAMNLEDGEEIPFEICGYEDAAGNVGDTLNNGNINTRYEKVVYDATAPARVYSTVRLDEEKEKNPEIGEDKNKYYYVKNGDKFVFAMAFTEELKQPPTVTIAGRNVEMKLNEKVKEEESKYLYEGTFTIPENEEELAEGKLEIKVSNIVDFAGNVMEDTIQTPTSNRRIVVYDRQAPKTGVDGFPLFFLNYRLDDKRPYTVIKDGEKLFVEANFTEKLAHNPKISLIRKDGTKTEAVEIPYVDMIGERYRYYAVLPFDAKDLQLENGDRINFEIADVEDKAGNTATFNNDNVTSMKLDDGREYGQVFYDNKALEYYSLEILNITHYEENEKIKKENENIENEADKKELKDLKVATTGDRIRVLISFPADGEKLAVEPKLRINGIECGTIPYSEPTSTSVKRPYYLVDFTIADETNIERHRIKLDEGLVNIEVYGYEDAAGNTISEPLTNKDIRNTNYTEIVYDVTAPVHYSLGIFNNTHYNENYNITDESKKKDLNCATTGDQIRIRISFEEKLAVAPKLKIGDKEIPWGLPFSQPTTDTSGGNYYYLTDIDLTEEMLDGMNLKDGAPIPIEVYGYEDAAGNVGDKITNIGENSGIRNDGEFTEVVYDISAPVIHLEAPDTFQVGDDTYTYPEAGSVTDNYDATRGLASAVHMNWYKVNDDGTETKVDPFVWNSKLTDIELGKYHITYETTDKAGNTAKADRYVTLKDTKAPEIKFKNGGNYEFNLGTDIYTYPEDLTVTDLRDGEMSVGDVNIVWYYVNEDGTKGNVAISENFPWDTNLKRLIDEGIVSPGSKLLVEYWIKDEAGNTGRASRTVTFVDKTAPEIEFKGEDEISYSSAEEAIAEYKEDGVTVSDLCDENVQNNVRIQINWYSIVDPNDNKEDVEYVGSEGNGRYNICYTVTDESGNKSKTIQRLVYVGMDN